MSPLSWAAERRRRHCDNLPLICRFAKSLLFADWSQNSPISGQMFAERYQSNHLFVAKWSTEFANYIRGFCSFFLSPTVRWLTKMIWLQNVNSSRLNSYQLVTKIKRIGHHLAMKRWLFWDRLSTIGDQSANWRQFSNCLVSIGRMWRWLREYAAIIQRKSLQAFPKYSPCDMWYTVCLIPQLIAKYSPVCQFHFFFVKTWRQLVEEGWTIDVHLVNPNSRRNFKHFLKLSRELSANMEIVWRERITCVGTWGMFEKISRISQILHLSPAGR